MVDILTDTGVFLDLDPDAEFELTIENPLLQEDRIPVPFSTAIAFLPTPTNKSAFGYLDTMMLEPRVKRLGASILVGGVQLYAGSLVYDSIDESGRINYTFSGKDLTKKEYDALIMTCKKITRSSAADFSRHKRMLFRLMQLPRLDDGTAKNKKADSTDKPDQSQV